MPKRASTCNLCKATFSKKEMTEHLDSCIQDQLGAKTASDKKRKSSFIHLLVEGRYIPKYWMHLAVKADVTLEDLDNFLRDIWLECCGHLSAFSIEGQGYSGAFPDVGDNNMEATLSEILSPGMKFYHEYDFGSTTELTLKVEAVWEGALKGKPVQLLGRNELPLIKCQSCGKLATQVCAECIYLGEGWLCDECAQKHDCGEEMLMPVVNSPRVGVCGYEG